MNDSLVFWAVVATFAFLFWTSRPFTPAPSLNGTVAVPRAAAHLTAWKEPTDATDIIDVVDDVTGAPVARYLRGRDGELREDPHDQPDVPAGDHHVHLLDTPVLALGSRGNTIGAFAGYYTGDLHHGHRAQMGLHDEPFSFLADTLHAPSVVLTPDLLGIGATLTLPPHRFPSLSRIGLGAWECAPFDGSHPALLYGAVLSTPFP